jgi:hypothetical protein
MVNQYVGILLEPYTFAKIKTGNTGREHLEYYREAGKKYGVIPCYFRIQDVQPNSPYLYAFVDEKDGMVYKKIPLPKVIHNRVQSNRRHTQTVLTYLSNLGIEIFNFPLKFGKWYIHQLIASDSTLNKYLPETKMGTEDSLKEMMMRHQRIIIKPDYSSIGMGVMMLNKIGSNWRLYHPTKTNSTLQKWNHIQFSDIPPSQLIRNLENRKYVIQERIPLATYKGRPFDLRVSAQKNHLGKWQISGIVAKIASPGNFVTNVAQQGTTSNIEKLLSEHPTLSSDLVKARVSELALKISVHLSKINPRLADLGYDIGVTEEGNPYFIECNTRDLRYSFKHANMIEEWKKVHMTPIGYASFLLKKLDSSKRD